MRSVSQFGKITHTFQEGHADNGVCLGSLSDKYMTSHMTTCDKMSQCDDILVTILKVWVVANGK